MTTHNLKTIQPFFGAVFNEIKNFEVRLNDRNFQLEDVLILEEYHPESDSFSGKIRECFVTSMLTKHNEYPDALKEGHVILGLDDYDFDITTKECQVGDEYELDNYKYEVEYVLSHRVFPQAINDGYYVVGLR